MHGKHSVVPAKAGTQRLSTNATGSPPSRGRRGCYGCSNSFGQRSVECRVRPDVARPCPSRPASNRQPGSGHDRRTAHGASQHAYAHRRARAVILVAAPLAHAQQPTSAQANAIRQSCRADFQANCAGVPTGGQAALACLQQNAAKASPACQQALRAVGDAAAAAPRAAAAADIRAPAAAAAAPAQAQAPAPVADTWPHTVTGENGTATIYQPQVIAWPEHRTLTARVAIGVTPNGAKTPLFGVVEVAFDTQTELAERTVVLTAPRLAVREVSVGRRHAGRAVRSADPRGARGDGRQARAAREHRAEPRAAGDEARRSPARQHAAAHLRQHAPGEPRRVRRRTGGGAVAGTSLSVVVNTNWDVFVDNATRTWYLLVGGSWMAAPDAKGPWMPAGPLPPAFAALPADANFAEREEADPRQADGRRRTRRPCSRRRRPRRSSSSTARRSTSQIRGTSLQYVANTDAALFKDASDGRYYYLVSGRWFAAPGFDGPWTFATASLPAGFARIPADGPRGFVLVSVPGHAAGAGSAHRGADSAAGNAEPRRGEARRRLRGRAEVRADRGHADELRGQHVVQRDPDGRRLLLVLPGRVVRRARARRAVDARGERAAGRLHDPAREPDVPVHVRARVRGDSADGHVRVHVGLRDELRQRRRRRLRHGLLLPAVRVPGADPDLLPVPVLVRGRDVLQRDDRRVGAGRRDLRTVRRRRERRHLLQPEHRRVRAGRRDLRAQRRRGRVLRLQPVDGQLRARQRRVGSRRRRPRTRAGTTRTRAARARRSRTATRTGAGARRRCPARTRPCTRRARATRRAPRDRSRRRAARRAPAFPARAATAPAWSRPRAATSTRAPTATCTRRPTAAGRSTTTARGTRSTSRRRSARRRNRAPRPPPPRSARRRAPHPRAPRPPRHSDRTAAGRPVRRRGRTPAGAAAGGSSRFEGFSQLEQDHSARMAGGARQQQFESMRGGFEGRGGMAGGGGFAGRGGGGFRR